MSDESEKANKDTEENNSIPTASFSDVGGPGDQIGSYKLLSVLGEGGFAMVYLAEQQGQVKRRVALKVIKPGMDTKEVIARFEAERQALALLKHPNIAQVYDAGMTPLGRPYFVMEYVKGIPITEHCDRQKLTIEERLKLFVKVCEAIQHAHQKAIIHRDIKPSNILVVIEGNKAVPKIIDFGVAKALSQPLTERTLYTEQGQFIGTPEYMSPEQAQITAQDIDTRSDIYSLGVVLYELLIGALPFDSEELRKGGIDHIRQVICETEPRTLSTRLTALGEGAKKIAQRRRTEVAVLAKRLHRELEWIPLMAMRKERIRRYRSASELTDDIENYIRGNPLMAGPPDTLYYIRKFIHRRRIAVIISLVVLISLLSGLGVATYGLIRAKDEAHRADKEAIIAEHRLQEILRLSDIKLLEDYKAQAETLWPCVPEKIQEMEIWLHNARELAGRLKEHEVTLKQLRIKAIPTRTAEISLENQVSQHQNWSFTKTDERWLHDVLVELVTGLISFQDTKHGVLHNVEKRLAFARTIYQKSIVDNRNIWDQTIAAIGYIKKCPWYKGLKLTYQLGLVPIGQDPESKLWEFAHLQTGIIPKRDSNGKLIISQETGIVFVLIPGGTFSMGAVKPSENKRKGSPNVDPEPSSSEAPIHRVTLAPFFLSKYEMTQGQWLRFAGVNPSLYGPNSELGGKQYSLLHPVEQVSWEDCHRVTGHLGLILPTEAQWEYATRGATTTVWWTGNEKHSIAGAANMADLTCAEGMAVSGWKYETWLEDGYVIHAPVGSYLGNHFGLHDVIGNVWEWCRDWHNPYECETLSREGERQVRDTQRRIFRGGSWRHPASEARSANRDAILPDNRNYYQGVRPARRISK